VPSGQGDTVRVEIGDDGRGLPATVLANPFEPHRGKRGPSAGAGLGLSIAHAVVIGHGGEISVEQAQQGTCFVISLPVVEEDPEDETTRPEVAQ